MLVSTPSPALRVSLLTTLALWLLYAPPTTCSISPGLPGLMHRHEQAPHAEDAEVVRRDVLTLTRTQTSEPAAATILAPALECTKYTLPAMKTLLLDFPPLWSTAEIMTDEARAIYDTIAPGIPPIAPKGTRSGDISSVVYPTEDPDCWWRQHQCVTPKLAGLEPDLWTCDEPHTLGLTYDDGPFCAHNALYDELNRRNQKATMFYIGSNIARWPLEAQRGFVEGHHICLHSWSHPYMTSLTDEQAWAEIYYSLRISKAVMGITPTCWRPPFGDIDDRIRYIANSLGLRSILWKDDSSDYTAQVDGSDEDTSSSSSSTVSESKANVIANFNNLYKAARNGSFDYNGTIWLEHEQSNLTVQIAVAELTSIQTAFNHVMPVSACSNSTRPYLEDYVFPNFQSYIDGNVLPIGLPAGGYLPKIPVNLNSTKEGDATNLYTYDVGSAVKAFTATVPTVTGSQALMTATTFPDPDTSPFSFNGNQTLPPWTPSDADLAKAKHHRTIVIIASAIGGSAALGFLALLLSCSRNRKMLRRSKREEEHHESTSQFCETRSYLSPKPFLTPRSYMSPTSSTSIPPSVQKHYSLHSEAASSSTSK